MITHRLIHDINKDGALYFLLNALIGAYNRRTDVIGKSGSGGIDLSEVNGKLDRLLEIVETDPAKIEALRQRLKSSTDALKSAVETNQPKGD